MKTQTTTVAVNNEEAVKELSAKTKSLIDAVRVPFSGYVAEMNVVLTKASKLAPAFMKAANAWMGETGRGFVHFVRELDPSVPTAQKHYTKHATFNRAVYLKRLVNKPKTKSTDTVDVGQPPVPAFTGMARLIAAIKPFVPEDQMPKLWNVIATELHWSDTQKERLQKLVEEAQPAFAVRSPRGGMRPVLRIAAPRHSQEETQESAAA